MRRMLLLAVVVLALVAVQAAAAGPGAVKVHGTWATVSSDPLGPCTSDPATPHLIRCLHSNLVVAYEGTLQGTSVSQLEWTLNCQTGRGHGTGLEVFAGTVAGIGQGTFTLSGRFAIRVDCTTGTFLGAMGTNVVTGAGGGLAGLRGRFAFTVAHGGGSGTYAGVFH